MKVLKALSSVHLSRLMLIRNNRSFLNEINSVNQNWKSNSRIFGAAIEMWVEKNLNCECSGIFINQKANQKAYDAICSKCSKKIQIKASKKIFKPNKNGELKILGSEYKTTLKSLNESNGWDLYLLAYNLEDYKIEQILMIKSSDINEECVIPRKKLGPNARRAGWQGCYMSFNWNDSVNVIYNKLSFDKTN